jgi:uncharacterized protein with GYD domain
MVLACIMIHCKPGTPPEVLKHVKAMNSVKRAFETLGAYDVVVEYEFQSLEKLGIAVYEMVKIPGVISTETLIETLL